MTTSPSSTPGVETIRLIDTEPGSASLRVGEATLSPGAQVPTHIHHNTEEAMVVLEGTIDVLVGEERMTLGPGDSMLAPAGAVHGCGNRCLSTAWALWPCTYPCLVFMMRLYGSVVLAFASSVGSGSTTLGFRPRFFLPVASSSARRCSTCSWTALAAASASRCRRFLGFLQALEPLPPSP